MIQKVLKLMLVVFAFGTFSAQAQTINVSGTITDASDGSTLPGVNVVIKGTATGVSSDFDGRYSIDVSDPDAVLQFSFLGYTMKEVPVAGNSTIDVALEPSAENLDEVVVTALGIKKSTKALGYSLTELGGDELSEVPQTNAVNALQGKVAGVNITQNATGAAGSSRVIIRGNSSLTGNNQPLYVVDGIPISNVNNGAAGMWGGNDGGDGISSINPQDIESVSVLKGGAASALYGSRASNGVIIVTTKTAKQQKGFGVEFSSSYTIDKVDTSLQDFQTTYGQGQRGAAPTTQEQAFEFGNSSWGSMLDGSSVVQWDGESRPYSYVGSNVENFYRSGSTFINTLALTGASENINYRFSASNLDNNDIMPNADMNRKTFSFNGGAVLNEKLTSTINAKYIIEEVNNRPRLSDAPGNGNYTVATLSPNVDVRYMNPGENPDGTERAYSSNIYSQNPYWAAYNFRNEDVKNRIIASTSLRYDFNDWLYAMGRIGVDHYTIRRTSVEPWGTAYKPLGGMTDTEIRYTQTDMDFILGIDKDITEDLNLTAFVGANSNYVENETMNLGGNFFIVPGLEDIANLSEQTRNHTYNERKIGSLYGSIEASYKNFAYVTFTGRNDWFSTLSFPGKTTPNDDFYPSISGSVILSELFDSNTVDFLKLRGGWSQVAGGAQDPYALSLVYAIFGQGHQGQSLGQIDGNIVPNPNLVPYNKDEWEIGFDTRMFANRLSLDVAYYSNKTTNDIVNVSSSVFSGFNGARANLGELTNQGVEWLIGGSPVKTDNFEWNLSFNGAYNDSEIVKTNDEGSDVNLDQARSQNVQIQHVIGQAYGTIYGNTFVRDDAGNIVYDIDATTGVPLAQRGGYELLGEGVPPLTLGLSNTFRYRDFSLYFLIDGKFGGQIYSGTNAGAYGNGLHKNTLEGRESGLEVSGVDGNGAAFTTIVAPEDLATYYGRISSIAEPFVEDADFIKFRQLSLSYNLPQSILSKTFISNLNISLIANNLFYIMRSIDNIDPEGAYNVSNSQGLEYYGVPSSRSWGLNLNVKF